MNFSNFFIEKLSETESTLALGSKKPAANPFLFQDIIKICEQETAAQKANIFEAGKAEPTLEIFAPTENVIKVSPEEFSNLTQLIASLISQNPELQPTETKHKIEDADITKLQFIIPEEKLVELAGKFIDKTSFPLIPLAETATANEITKPLTISYKSGSNKLSVTVNPIKVDENYTSKVINDEFSFVNKLMVNEGLLQNNPLVVKDDTELIEQELPLIADSVEVNSEAVSIEEKKIDLNEKVFYKAEIIKIEVPQTETASNFPIVSTSSDTQTELFNVNMLFQQTEKTTADETVSSNKNTSDLFEGFGVQKPGKLNSASETKHSDGSLNQTVSVSTQPPFESNPSAIANSAPEVKTELQPEAAAELGKSDTAKAAANPTFEKPQSEPNVLVGTTKENVTNDKSLPASLNDLMEGLTDEEKSVFKSFAASGGIKEIKYESTPKISTNTIKPVEQKISSETLPNVNGVQEKSLVVDGKSSVSETFAKDGSTKPAEVKENANAKSLESKEVIAEKPVAQEKSPVVESKTSVKETYAKDESVKPAEVKENVNVKPLVNKEVIAEKPVALEKSSVVEGKTSVNETIAKDESVKPAEVKENVNVKPLNNVEVITEKQTSVEKTASKELVNKEIPVKKEVSNNDKAASGVVVKETTPKKAEGRPKLVSKEEFLAAKTLNQAAQPKVAAEEKAIAEKVIAPTVEVESAVIKETVEAKQKASQPEVAKNSVELSGEGKLLVKVSAKASIKVDKSSKEEVDTKPQTGNSLSKEVKANDAEYALQKEERIIAETAKTVSLKNEKGEQVVANINVEVSSSTTKEKAAQVKTDVDTKEQTTVHTKETKQTSEAQTNQQSDKENGKSNSSETFKNHLNQAVSSDKNFEVENLKPQVDAKQAHEAFKTVKQHEIMPEFSKLILQGEKQTMTLQLTPENLGKVKLTVDMIENQIVTKIEVENEQVKQFVQSNIEQLKQNMQSAGIPLTNVNVSLADDQKNQKVFTQKKKSLSRDEKEEVIEETTMNQSKKQMGYNTYEFTA